MEQTYDVIVIGAGPVGENAADRAARGGLSVAVVEAELVGGECSYWACIPSKTLLHPGAARQVARDAAGVADPGPLDVSAVLARRDEMTGEGDDSGQEDWLASVGITLVRGHGRLVGERLVEVVPATGVDDDAEGETHRLAARCAVVVSTGSAPVVPDVPGLAAANPWTSREATAAEAVPESLVILGGGVVGVEMATAYADLGARVTLLAREGLLEGAEPFAGEMVADALRAAGVDVRLGVEARRVERPAPGGPVTVTVAGDDGPGPVTGAELLVATGRRPRTGDVGLDSVGLEPGTPLTIEDSTAVQGVARDVVGHPWLFACGDVTGRVGTTHQGKYQARVAGDVIAALYGSGGDGEAAAASSGSGWSRYAARADHGARTHVVFAHPEVAWVGPTEAEATRAGLPVRTVSVDLGGVAGAAVTSPHYAGRVQVLVDTEREVIVGATVVGPDAAEMLHAATIAVVAEVPLGTLWHAVPAFPTVSEMWLRLLEAYGL
ncbi:MULTISPECIES: NAD(P)/FAD-dependent oxidoreductase [unclassified Isoptericola]|uniref:dihydrolipoyl dehydrogenase family protein n=1 Tax=unclassified Isoptericola TaxID=2623355 RepID=UPI00271242E3|nr:MULTISPECIES: NAD(P)/FAD-dependent oxidoreductase [unclassified Isoptericola]MDO8144449.1 NAD(P)/FAD-dependent oxidoreductase [Isoptericola sp. 178]MDO8148303.1 NAD(P)/FAD-dependent oxidoreductase [Isoptericola sp. b515]